MKILTLLTLFFSKYNLLYLWRTCCRHLWSCCSCTCRGWSWCCTCSNRGDSSRTQRYVCEELKRTSPWYQTVSSRGTWRERHKQSRQRQAWRSFWCAGWSQLPDFPLQDSLTCLCWFSSRPKCSRSSSHEHWPCNECYWSSNPSQLMDSRQCHNHRSCMYTAFLQ